MILLRRTFSDTSIFPDVDVLVIMVTNEAQAESVLYGEGGAVAGTIQYHMNISLAVLTLSCVFCSPSLWSIYHPFIHCFPRIHQPAGATPAKYVFQLVIQLPLLW